MRAMLLIFITIIRLCSQKRQRHRESDCIIVFQDPYGEVANDLPRSIESAFVTTGYQADLFEARLVAMERLLI